MKPTCGSLFHRFFPEYNMDIIRGFIYGEAEKVYLGVRGAMFHYPNRSHIPENDVVDFIKEVAEHFGLVFESLNYNNRKEYWLLRPDSVAWFRALAHMKIDCEEWHYLRGKLCGIPTEEIDPNYSERYNVS